MSFILQNFLSYTLAFFKCFPPNYICCFSSTWLKIYLHPKSPVKKKKPSIQEHTICTAMHDTQVTDSFRSESNGGGGKCHKACCVCFLVIYLTFQTIFMLKEYLSNIWRVSACYSSQKRKITGFNPQNHSQLLDMNTHLAPQVFRQHFAFEVQLL